MDCDKQCCGCEKMTERSDEEKKKLINRLSRIEGQVRGLRGMIEKDAYCVDILMQSTAVQSALQAFSRDLLARHVRTCVARDLRDGKDEVVDELVEALSRLMR